MATLQHDIKVIQAAILKGEGNKKAVDKSFFIVSDKERTFQRNSSAPTPTGLPNGEGVNGVND